MASKGKVLITDSVHHLLPEGLSALGYEPVYLPDISRTEVLEIIPEYTGLIINTKIFVDMQLLDKGKSLRFVGRLGAGLEIIDQAYAEKKGIIFFNSPEGNRDAVAEHAIGMLLGLLNHLHKADREVRNQQWLREQNRGTELGGKTVGIIGFGNTGRAFAKKLSGFGVRILAYDKYVQGFGNEGVEESALDDLFADADILSLHVQLTNETKYMVNRAFLERFRKPIYLINTSRGQVVKTTDLLWGLKSGKVLGAAIDVLEQEKLDEMTEQQRSEFLELTSNGLVMLTPHIAGWTYESKRKIAETILLKLKEIGNRPNEGRQRL